MSTRRRLAGRNSQAVRSRSGLQPYHQAILQQGPRIADVQRENQKLRTLNEGLHNQNADLARELNEVKSRLQIHRQRQREMERNLYKRVNNAQTLRGLAGARRGWVQNDCIGDSGSGVKNGLSGEAGGALPSASKASPESESWSVRPIVRIANTEQAASKRRQRRSSLLPRALLNVSAGDGRKEMKAVLSPREEKRNASLSPPDVPISSGASKNRGLDSPAITVVPATMVVGVSDESSPGGAIDHPSEAEMFSTEPFNDALDQSASDEQDAPKTPDASSARKSSPCRPTPRLPSPSSSAMPWGIPVPLSTSPPGLLHHTPPYSTLNDTLASEDVGGSTVIPNATARVQLSPVSTEPSPTAREASVAAAAAATTATARGGGTGESRRRPGERPRRQVAQPVSYQEPLLNVKMRKGHVMFPKAKGQGQRGPNKDKENDGRERGERGDKKP